MPRKIIRLDPSGVDGQGPHGTGGGGSPARDPQAPIGSDAPDSLDQCREPVRIRDYLHATTVLAPAGAGKGTGLPIPYLPARLGIVVIDPQGELFRQQASESDLPGRS